MTRGVQARRPWRTRCVLAAASCAGVGLFIWTIWSVGPHVLAAQLRGLAPVIGFIIILGGVRFWLQAAGWRLAMTTTQRPTWREVFGAVVAGEAAGYFAWGTVSREPMKALLVGHRLPERAALGAAIIERFYYSVAAATLIVGAIAIAALRYHFVGRFLIGAAIAAVVIVAAHRRWRLWWHERTDRGPAAARLMTLGIAQEASNLLEAYVVLAWLGAGPTIASVIVLEGIGRLLNSAGQFIPGKLGITEAATTTLAQSLRLGSAHGLSLALARRARALVWGAGGIALIALRAAATPANRELQQDLAA